jgi:hypothetical protein
MEKQEFHLRAARELNKAMHIKNSPMTMLL